MLSVIVFTALFGVFYAYFGYPLILMFANLGRRYRVALPLEAQDLPSISVIVTVRNEEKVIVEKIADTMELSYAGRSVKQLCAEGSNLVELIIASDASDDQTDEIVRSLSSQGVKLVRLEERGGKEKAQQAAVAQSSGEIILFTDAKIVLNKEALVSAVAYFADESVGAVSSTDVIMSSESGGSGEGLYVAYEMWLRRQESVFNSLVGLSGSCFAVRREIAEKLRTNIPSDFALLIESQRQRMRGVHAENVVGSYKAVRTEKQEFQRKVRTVLRGISACFASAEVLDPARFGRFAWQVWSHKVCRWMVPWLLIVAYLGSMFLAISSYFYLFCFVGMSVFFSLGFAASQNRALQSNLLFKVPLFFSVVNAAILVAWVKYVMGERSVAWNPSQKG